MSLRDRLIKNSTIKDTSILETSKFFNKKDMIKTSIPAINIAYSGTLDGGLTPGLTQWAGPSRHFKTLFSLLSAKAYLDKYEDAVLLFYDSEFGTPKSYFGAVGIDESRTIHTPLVNIEEMKFDVMTQLDQVVRGDHLIIVIDSIGNMASKKEVDDALDGKSVADMTRAKQLKSFFRMVTPHLNLKDIPMICVNHVYMTQEMFSKPIVSGGCLLAGIKLQMFDNSLKNIEDILIGDLVKTLEGPKVVTETWNPDTLENGTPECYEIEFEDGYKVICSDKHPFLVDGKWIEAQNLTLLDEVEVC